MPTDLFLDHLATSFRAAPCSPSHHHADVYNKFEQIGGAAAIAYGMFVATPFRMRWKKHDAGLAVADALDAMKAAK